MIQRHLPVPDGYDAATQATVALLAAALDDQSRRMKEALVGLEVKHLEWQERPGRNSIGMLLSHISGVEVGWVCGAPHGKWFPMPEAIALIEQTTGITEDGMPLAADGTHPGSLAGKTLDDYFAMLDGARAAVHAELRTWPDTKLAETLELQRGDRQVSFTHGWILYHVLEHLAGHFGQVLLVQHSLRDHGLLG